RQFSFRRQDHYPAGMRVLFGLLVPGVTKTNRLRQPLDVGFIASQKMPVRLGSRTVVSLDVSAFLGRGQVRRLARIKTDGDHVKLFANIERDLSERTHH